MSDNYLDPKEFNLSSRVILEKISNENIAIVKDKKSRIIMKDGLNILGFAKKIWLVSPSLKILVKTNAPICSKTLEFLKENSILIDKL